MSLAKEQPYHVESTYYFRDRGFGSVVLFKDSFHLPGFGRSISIDWLGSEV